MKTLYKKLYLFILPFLILVNTGLAQSFYSGGIGVTLNDYGRIRVFSDNLTTRQVDRSSILVGVSSSAVFDYTEDAENVTLPATVGSPLQSDHEVTVTIDNSYNGQFFPPNVEVEEHIFGWNSGGYALGKLIVKNNETAAINAVMGLEIIPQIDGEYSSINTSYNASSQIVVMSSTSYLGYKFFSETLTSMHSFDWFSGYGNNADYFTWLTQNSFDAPFTCGVDGSVIIMGSTPVTINPGETHDFYFGISIGQDETTMTDNMNAAENQYNTIVPVELTAFTASINKRNVTLNWQTATEINNRGFEIERKLISGNESRWITIGFKEGFGTTAEVQSYFFTDNIFEISSSKINYRLKQIDFDGTFSYSDEVEVDVMPFEFSLSQNYPNPFNPSTVISFAIANKEFVSLKVFNLLGQEVSTLINKELEAGSYNFKFDAENLTSGIYLYTLSAGPFKETKKMILVR